MTFNSTTNQIELSSYEQGELFRLAHYSNFTTKEILDRVLEVHSSNFWQDATDAVHELEDEEDNKSGGELVTA